jgi:hypothetical protein
VENKRVHRVENTERLKNGTFHDNFRTPNQMFDAAIEELAVVIDIPVEREDLEERVRFTQTPRFHSLEFSRAAAQEIALNLVQHQLIL